MTNEELRKIEEAAKEANYNENHKAINNFFRNCWLPYGSEEMEALETIEKLGFKFENVERLNKRKNYIWFKGKVNVLNINQLEELTGENLIYQVSEKYHLRILVSEWTTFMDKSGEIFHFIYKID